MRILFTCGGTGGHINPAISVANLIKAKHPEAEILFAGATGGIETDLVPREGYMLKTVDISNFQRKLTPGAIAHNVKLLFTLNRSNRQAKEILHNFRPNAVIGTGGYASYPIIREAAAMGIPTAIHESNFAPGLTTRMLAGKVNKVMVNYPRCAEGYPDISKVVVTGTPVREGFVYLTKAEARRRLGLDNRPVVISYWGSLGAREMNKRIADFIKLESSQSAFHHIHATGSFGWRWMPDLIQNMGVDLTKCPTVDMREYIFDMPTYMAAADLVICRGGASTLSELCAAATPAIIVPSPNVTENHQEKNARALEQQGAAIVITEDKCTGQGLYEMVTGLLSNTSQLHSMEKALASMAVPDAAERIYKIIQELIA